ncbi:hypothetical protein [Gloeocapsopsis dulcis]|uniref:Uncharacterized protein n=1 Tax=Gloeocapsopsis dulcis AAB1 = 1H9 TaxID=1433147 RepID=A0A6N8FYZ8_9CHRO|nr:hypothetical protein [Gloeocapsopsis dulcis]MUL38368.1 hypothetical protein [Gloeocapsopsis dulcis AAB1 = 1H9]WNN91588.1 hypothetical protein P0S91_11175 [Gloeocapsopsis dulcis]
MTVKSNDSADSFLILILPVALAITFLFSTWRLLLAIAGFTLLLNIFQRYRWQKWSQTLNPTFHKLIQENQGRITPLDLAMRANLPAAKAKRYLDYKAAEFGARVLEPEDGNSGYFFVTAKTLGSIFDDSELPFTLPNPESEQKIEVEDLPESTKNLEQLTHLQSQAEQMPLGEADHSFEPTHTQEHLAPDSLLQSELAKRLAVNSSTVYKHRSNPDFSEWSRSRDPEGIAWQYSSEDKRFFPVAAE